MVEVVLRPSPLLDLRVVGALEHVEDVFPEERHPEIGVCAKALGKDLLGLIALDLQGPQGLLQKLIHQLQVLQTSLALLANALAVLAAGQLLLVLPAEAHVAQLELSPLQQRTQDVPADFIQLHYVLVDVAQDVEGEVDEKSLCSD